MSALDRELAALGPTDPAPRLVGALFLAVPGSPSLIPYASLDEALAVLGADLDDAARLAAKAAAEEAGISRVLTVGQSIDAGDTGLSIVTGVRSVMGLFFGGGEDKGLQDEGQQKTDAVLKAAAIAFAIDALFGTGGVEAARQTVAGRALFRYFGAVEIALPFRAAVQAAGGTFVTDLVEQRVAGLSDKLSGLVGPTGGQVARAMLAQLVPVLEAEATLAVGHVDAMAETVKGFVPLLGGQAVTDLAATGADALPVYRYLLARLAAEACLSKARPAPVVEVPESTETADPVAADPGDPFADPVAADPANPFADPEPAAPAAAPGPSPLPPDAVAPGPPPPPPAPALPVPHPPAGPHQTLEGVYCTEDGRWWVFSPDGYASDHPPADPPPHDWQAHLDAGHPVGTYRRSSAELVVDGLSAVSRVDVQQYAVVLDGVTCARADFDLSGRTLDGTWGPWRLSADGRFAEGGSPIPEGTYTLGRGSLILRHEDGRERVLSLFSTLEPTSRAPDRVCIGGVVYDRG